MASIPKPILGWVRQYVTSQGLITASEVPVQSVGGETGDVLVGGPLFDETSSIELILQWENFFVDELETLETAMDDSSQADAVTSSPEAMALIFDIDKR